MQRGVSRLQRRILTMVLTLTMILSQVANVPLAQAAGLSSGLLVYLDQAALDTGATTTLKLYAQKVSANPVEIAGYQVSISFDPQAVQVINVNKPSGSTGNESIQQFVYHVDQETNTINIVAAGSSGFSGNMVLAEIKVRGVGSAGTKTLLPVNVQKITDAQLNSIPNTTQPGVITFNYSGSIYLSKVQDLFLPNDQNQGSLTAVKWSGLTTDKPETALNVHAGDPVNMSAVASAAQTALLPPTAAGELLATDGSGRTWSLPNLNSTSGFNQSAAPDSITVRLPRNVPDGDYILTAQMPSGKQALLTDGSAQAAVTLHVDSKWAAQSLLKPFDQVGGASQDPKGVTENLTLPSQFTTFNNIAFPGSDSSITVDWTSSNPLYLSIPTNSPTDVVTGVVNRPGYRDGDKNLTLSAALHWGEAVQSLAFPLTIKANLPTEADALLLAADNLTAWVGDTTKLRALTTGANVTLPVSGAVHLPGVGDVTIAISWAVLNADHSTAANVSVDNSGKVVVASQPAYGEPDQTLNFQASIKKDNTVQNTTSTGQGLVFSGKVLAQAKSPSEIDSATTALSGQISGGVDAAAAAILAAASAANEADLAKTALAADSLNDVVSAVNNQMTTVVAPLLEILNQSSGNSQAAADMVQNAAQVAVNVANRSDAGQNLSTTLQAVTTVAQTVSQAVNSLSGNPNVDVTQAKSQLQDVYTQLTAALSQSNAVTAGSQDANAVGNALAAAAENLTTQTGPLSSALQGAGILDPASSAAGLMVPLQAGGDTSTLPIDSLSSVASQNVGLSLVPPSSDGAAGAAVNLPAGVLQQAVTQAGNTGSSGGNLDFVVKSVPTDANRPEPAADTTALVVPFSIEVRQGDTALQMQNLSPLVWITMPIQLPMTVAQAVDLRDSGKLVAQYYSTTSGGWQTLDGANGQIKIDPVAGTIAFPTNHFTQFTVNTKSSDTTLSSLQVQLGGQGTVSSLDPLQSAYDLRYPLAQGSGSLTLNVTPHDPAAQVSGSYVEGGNNQIINLPFTTAPGGSGNVVFNTNIPLDASGVAITLKVTAVDGTTETHILNVQGLAITTPMSLTASQDITYDALNPLTVLQAGGGRSPYIWTSPRLPFGLSLSSAGSISGKPSGSGTGTFTATVTDAGEPALTVSKTFSLTVTASGGNPGGSPGGSPGGATTSPASGPVNGVWQIQPSAAQRTNATAVQSLSPGQAGSLKSADGTQVTLRTDALTAQTNITINLGSVGIVPKSPTVRMFDPVLTEREFGPSGQKFTSPVMLTLPYGGIDLSGLSATQLALFYWNGADWVKVGGTVDTVKQTVTAPVYHFSTYAVMADISIPPERLAGSDRFATAVEVSQDGWQGGAEQVVLVNAYSFPDALAATPLAYKQNAPILLTAADALPEATISELRRLQAKSVTILGGAAAVSAGVENQLKGLGLEVIRYGGKDRYETAVLAAGALGTSGQAVVVSGEDEHFPDALAVAGWAAFHGIPILFSAQEALPEATTKALADQKVKSTVVVGGVSAVSDRIFGALPLPVRYAGQDRFETAAAVADGLQLNPSVIYVATGLDFVDALVAGNLAAKTNSPLLLIDQDLPIALQHYLGLVKGKAGSLILIGGESVINTSQETALRNLLP